ncbi:MAG: VOC family protein [Sphingomonadales bacterium]
MIELTPVLFVEKIEPSLVFWEERLGFTRLTEVPGKDGLLQFVMLAKDGAQVMLQTFKALDDDLPDVARELDGSAPNFLYLKVPDLEAVIEQVGSGIEVAVERRTTFYGADEISFREPGGHFITFAQFPEAEGAEEE